MGEVIDMFSRKRIEQPAGSSAEQAEEKPDKAQLKKEEVAAINSVDSEKYKLLFALKRGFPLDENSVSAKQAREVLASWSKQQIAEHIMSANEQTIKSKPAFFITAVNKLLE
jgi:hypothetical protein